MCACPIQEAEPSEQTKTVYSLRLNDPDEHHPEPDCPKRLRILKRGNYEKREVADPSMGFAAQKRSGGRRMVRRIGVCPTCQASINIRNQDLR